MLDGCVPRILRVRPGQVHGPGGEADDQWAARRVRNIWKILGMVRIKFATSYSGSPCTINSTSASGLCRSFTRQLYSPESDAKAGLKCRLKLSGSSVIWRKWQNEHRRLHNQYGFCSSWEPLIRRWKCAAVPEWWACNWRDGSSGAEAEGQTSLPIMTVIWAGLWFSSRAWQWHHNYAMWLSFGSENGSWLKKTGNTVTNWQQCH